MSAPGSDHTDIRASDILADKAALRRRMRSARKEAWDRSGSRAAITLAAHGDEPPQDEKALPTGPFSQRDLSATVVSGYWPIGQELDPRPLMAALSARGAVLTLPVTCAETGVLRFRLWHQDNPLEDAGFGTLAPGPSAGEAEPDFVLVPLLAFDRSGARLGYGQGHYDRTLADLRSRRAVETAGIAFSVQEIDAVPVEGHDVPLDWILTEKEAIPCKASPR